MNYVYFWSLDLRLPWVGSTILWMYVLKYTFCTSWNFWFSLCTSLRWITSFLLVLTLSLSLSLSLSLTTHTHSVLFSLFHHQLHAEHWPVWFFFGLDDVVFLSSLSKRGFWRGATYLQSSGRLTSNGIKKTSQANPAEPVVTKKAMRSFYLDFKKYNAGRWE